MPHPEPHPELIRALLLDIEGTTTPVDFVYGTLFPFAKANLSPFLTTYASDPGVQSDLAQLRREYASDSLEFADLPAWPHSNTEEITAAVPYLEYLIAIDRKSTGLKALQGKIWDQGYRDGTLRSQMFDDVAPALARWSGAGRQVYIFSSGSVQAQQQLFYYSEAGDLTPYLSGYFDTTTGPKRFAESYRAIAQAIGQEPGAVLFISDVAAELHAAVDAGMPVLFSARPGNPNENSEGHSLIRSFEDVL
jgi:enolase-phosphatase E1